MPFTPKEWKDFPDKSTPITAEALTDLEERIYEAASQQGDKFYEHNQSSPSDSWNITHNLGKKPSVTVVDSGGTQWHTEVQHINNNQCVARFSSPFSGKAYLN
jgi:hypothetical protein